MPVAYHVAGDCNVEMHTSLLTPITHTHKHTVLMQSMTKSSKLVEHNRLITKQQSEFGRSELCCINMRCIQTRELECEPLDTRQLIEL